MPGGTGQPARGRPDPRWRARDPRRAAAVGTIGLRSQRPAALARRIPARHPQLQLRLLLGDGLTDLFRQPVDSVLRYGEPQDSSPVALPVAAGNRRCCALRRPTCSASGAAAVGRTGRAQLPALHARRTRARPLVLQEGRRARTVQVSGDRVSDDADVVRRWPWPASGWPTSRGWTSPMTWRPVACGCCCRSASAKRRHWPALRPPGPAEQAGTAAPRASAGALCSPADAGTVGAACGGGSFIVGLNSYGPWLFLSAYWLTEWTSASCRRSVFETPATGGCRPHVLCWPAAASTTFRVTTSR